MTRFAQPGPTSAKPPAFRAHGAEGRRVTHANTGDDLSLQVMTAF